MYGIDNESIQLTSKILLISLNTYATPYPVFPLGISFLASSLKTAGYDFYLYDFQREGQGVAHIIAQYKPDYIGVSLRNIDDVSIHKKTFFVTELLNHLEEIRTHSSVPIILGGSGFSLFPEKILDLSKAEYGIIGEGESSLITLLRNLENHRNIDQIPGLVFRKKKTIISNSPQPGPQTKIQSALRPKTLSRFYIEHSSILNIQTQRGCAHSCCYCTYPLIEGSRFRVRDYRDVVDEISELVSKGAPYITFVDSIFNSSVNHVTQICEEIIRRNIRIPWSCYLRPKGLGQPVFDLMKKAGLKHIEFGTDSLCDSVLERYNKHLTFHDILQASRCAQNAKVHYAHFLILGGPGETVQTLQETFSCSKHLKNTVFFPFIGMRVYPNTPLQTYAIAQGIIPNTKDLLKPFFYVSPDISINKIDSMVQNFNADAKNWFIGESPPEFDGLKKKLRNNGFCGPLWEYLKR